MTPQVSVYQQVEDSDIDPVWIERTASAALPLVQQHLKGEAPLAELAEIESTIVSDNEIARVHAEFLDDPTPTDVITFHHGEIIVSADTARREGPAHGNSINEELALYLIHGLMHLAGWDDHEANEAAEMKRIQESILEQVKSCV